MAEKIYGLLGRKLGHSWSVPIHTALGCEGYRLFEREPEELPALLARPDIGGLNVTLPHAVCLISRTLGSCWPTAMYPTLTVRFGTSCWEPVTSSNTQPGTFLPFWGLCRHSYLHPFGNSHITPPGLSILPQPCTFPPLLLWMLHLGSSLQTHAAPQ